MNALTRHISVCVISVAALVSGCTRVGEPESIFDDSPPVAIVAGKAISGEEYRRTYVDYLLDTGLPDAPERREAFLRRMVNVSLIAERERSAGIERTDAYRERARLVSSRLLVDSFVERQIYAQIEITEEDLKEMFVRANTEMTVRHLYARTIEDAERLRARLQAGETFERLAQEVFDDPQLASSGGLVGPFGFDEMDPAFEEAAFSLARGTVSEPVRTANGYSILRVEERITKPLLTETEFAERRDRLEAQVAFRRKARARAEYLAGLMTELDPVFESNTLEALAAQLLTGRPAEAETLSDQDILVRMRGGNEAWTIGDFREASERVSEEQIARIRTPRDLTTFVEGLLAREEMIRRARRSGLD
ncbi:MAG: peptidylprolyl isomerase, partial [Rhodothermales bacterium]|nr:peptidylprolyl isomerase [Rhodothermales bacterium]